MGGTYTAPLPARWIGRVVASTTDEAKSSRGTVLHAPPDLVDDDAVVLIPFAVADSGLENLSVQPRERQILSDLARLRQNEFHILEGLARASFSREVPAHHLGALGVHDLRIGRRLARDLEEACGLKPEALRKNKPFRERQAVEAEDQIDGKLGAAGAARGPHVEVGGKDRTQDIGNLVEFARVAADKGHTAALPNLLASAGYGSIEKVEPMLRHAPGERADTVRIAGAGAEDELA